jgi:hypothetical protein
MKLTKNTVMPSPDCDERIHLVGEVTYDDPSLSPESYWFEFPTEYADSVSMTSDPWMTAHGEAGV